MAYQSKLRRESRLAAPATVRVMWHDSSGCDKYAIVKSRDISQSGMRIELPEAVEPRSYVQLQCLELGLQGTASVRSCSRQGMRYMIGLEFAGGLKWTPKPSQVAEN